MPPLDTILSAVNTGLAAVLGSSSSSGKGVPQVVVQPASAANPTVPPWVWIAGGLAAVGITLVLVKKG